MGVIKGDTMILDPKSKSLTVNPKHEGHMSSADATTPQAPKIRRRAGMLKVLWLEEFKN